MDEDIIGAEIVVDLIDEWTEAVESERRIRKVHDLDPWVPGLGRWFEEHDVELVFRDGSKTPSVRIKSQSTEDGLQRLRRGYQCLSPNVDPVYERTNGIHTNPVRLADHLRNVREDLEICE